MISMEQFQTTLKVLRSLDHIWCQHSADTAPVILMLYSFQEATLEKAAIKSFREKSNETLSACPTCVERYHASVEEEKTNLASMRHGLEALKEIQARLTANDKARILAIFEDPDPPLRQLQVSTFELLQYWEVLADEDLLAALVGVISRNQRVCVSTNSATELPDALYYFLFHEKMELRIWARNAARKPLLEVEQTKRLKGLLTSVCYHLAQDSVHENERNNLVLEESFIMHSLSVGTDVLWKALQSFVSLCEDTVIERYFMQPGPPFPLIVDLLLEKLGTAELTLEPCLVILSRFAAKDAFWKDREEYFPQVVLSALTSNEENMLNLLGKGDNTVVERVFGWLPYLVQNWKKALPEQLGLLLDVVERWGKTTSSQAIYDACFREEILILASMEPLEDSKIPQIEILMDWAFSEKSDAAVKHGAFHLLGRCLANEAADSASFYQATSNFLDKGAPKPEHKQSSPVWTQLGDPKCVEGLPFEFLRKTFSLLPSFLPRIGSVSMALLNDAKSEDPLFDAVVTDHAGSESTAIGILRQIATSLNQRQVKSLLEMPGAVAMALDFLSRPSQDLHQAISSVLSRGFHSTSSTILELSAVTELVLLSREQALGAFYRGLNEFISDTKRLAVRPPKTELSYSLLADFVPLLRQLGKALKTIEIPSRAVLFELEYNRSQPRSAQEQPLSRLWAATWEAIICAFAVATLSPSPEEQSMIDFLVIVEKMLAETFLSNDLKDCYQSARKAAPSEDIHKLGHPLLNENGADGPRLFCHQFEKWVFYLFPWLACEIEEISERTMGIVELAAGMVLEGAGLKKQVAGTLAHYSQALPEWVAPRLGNLIQRLEEKRPNVLVLPLPATAPPRPNADITSFFKKSHTNQHPSEEPQWLSKSHPAALGSSKDLSISAAPLSRHSHHEREPPSRTLPASFAAVSPHATKRHPTGSSHSTTFRSKELRDLAKNVASKSSEPPRVKAPVTKSSDIRPFSDIGELSADQTRVREQLQGTGQDAGEKRIKLVESSDVRKLADSGKISRPPSTKPNGEVYQDAKESAYKIFDFYRSVLSWDYKNMRSSEQAPLQPFPMTFQSFVEYQKAFVPLLIRECHQSIVTVQEERGSRARSGTWQVRILEISREGDFEYVTFGKPQASQENLSILGDNTLVLIEKNGSGSSFFGIVSTTTRKLNEAKVMTLAEPKKQLTMDKTVLWNVTEITSLSTAIREFQALCRMSTLSERTLGKTILNPSGFKGKHIIIDHDLQKESTFNYLKEFYNQFQIEAVRRSLSSMGFHLIQGPPGTGKTRTILAIIGGLLTMRSRGKILVCTQSNTAVDEIALRLRTGALGLNGKSVSVDIVRLGVAENIHEDVRKEFYLDAKVEREFGRDNNIDATDQKLSEAREALNDIEQKMEIFEKTIGMEGAEGAAAELAQLKAVRGELARSLKLIKEERSKAEGNRKALKTKILQRADVVCATLSASGHEILTELKDGFETVIIDEAAQSVEPSTLIPLRYNCRRCILVGDPKQLPPTILSQSAKKAGYETTLFERMQKLDCNVVLLSLQYRMHPEISSFPSNLFYASKLMDYSNMKRERTIVFNQDPNSMFRPYTFFDFRGKEHGHPSIRNAPEAELVCNLIKNLCTAYPEVKFGGRIGVISPYKGQTFEILDNLKRSFGSDVTRFVEVDTVDGFQGREKDIIIISCVRCRREAGIGFLADQRRMNVALTRAKFCLFVVGDQETLSMDENWDALVKDSRKRGLVTRGTDVRILTSSPRNLLEFAEVASSDLPQARIASKVSVPGSSSSGSSGAPGSSNPLKRPLPSQPEDPSKRPRFVPPPKPRPVEEKLLKPSKELF